jgi:hypothetical protein
MDEVNLLLTTRMDGYHHHILNRTDNLHQATNERSDRYVRWLAGIMLAQITVTAGIWAKMLLS